MIKFVKRLVIGCVMMLCLLLGGFSWAVIALVQHFTR